MYKVILAIIAIGAIEFGLTADTIISDKELIEAFGGLLWAVMLGMTAIVYEEERTKNK